MNSASFQYTPPSATELPPPYSIEDSNYTLHINNTHLNQSNLAAEAFVDHSEINRIAHPHVAHQVRPPVQYYQPMPVKSTPLNRVPRKSISYDDYRVHFNPTQQCKPRYKIPWEIKEQRIHDWIFVPVFPLVVGAFGVLSYEALKTVVSNKNYTRISDHIFKLGSHGILVTCVSVFTLVFLLGFLQMLGMLLFYKFFISFIFTIGIFTCMGLIWYFYSYQQWLLCGVGAIWLTITFFWIHRISSKLKFSAELMKSGSKMMRSNVSIWIIYTIMFLANTLAVMFYCIVVSASYLAWKDEMDKTSKYCVGAWLVFSGYYMYEVFQNSMNVIIGSICAKWYFQSEVSDYKAILTPFGNCFGSICVGSLLASIVSFLKELILFSKPNDRLLQNPVIKISWKIAQLTMIFLDYTIQYFNQYAFSYIAVHCKGYFKSSYRMYRLYNNKGFSVLLSESIIKIVLQFYLVFSGCFSGTLAYITCRWYLSNMKVENVSAPVDVSILIWTVVVASSLIALQISRMTALMINVYVHVFLVCVIEYPEILQNSHPEIHASLAGYLPNKSKGGQLIK
jgi:hypothetical protein